MRTSTAGLSLFICLCRRRRLHSFWGRCRQNPYEPGERFQDEGKPRAICVLLVALSAINICASGDEEAWAGVTSQDHVGRKTYVSNRRDEPRHDSLNRYSENDKDTHQWLLVLHPNPDTTALTGIRRECALASAKMDFSAPDAADENLLNRVIWYATKGFDTPYPGDVRVLAPSEVHPYLSERARVQSRRDRTDS